MQRVFFNHIPKTAGTSVGHFIAKHYSIEEIMPEHFFDNILQQCGLLQKPMGNPIPLPNSIQNKVNKLLKNNTVFDYEDIPYGKLLNEFHYIQSHINIRNALDNRWKIVTFLRDPLDRLVSLYNYLSRWSDEFIDTLPIPIEIAEIHKSIKKLTLPEVLQIDHPKIEYDFKNAITKCLVARFPSANWQIPLATSDSKLEELALKNLNKMHSIGLMETFYDSMILLQHRMNWPIERKFEKLNVAPKKTIIPHYSAHEMEIINEAIYLDRKVYNHGKKLFMEMLVSLPKHLHKKPNWISRVFKAF